jgi:CheY-like chemotaxis protein
MGLLFTEFQQLEAGMGKKYAGTGLGLVLTKRMVEAQGGRVGAESTLGKGSVFWALLPRMVQVADHATTLRPTVRPAVRPPSAGPPGSPAGAGAVTILVVEDSAEDRSWLVRTLSDAGYVVETARDGTEALALCRCRAFDAITLDILLPDVSGLKVLRELRELGPNQATPVIVLSILSDLRFTAGFAVCDVLSKPATAAQLLSALQRGGVSADGPRPVLVTS